MSSLKNLTIVTLSYCRQNYLCRSLEYWSGREPTILALDGSPEGLHASNLKRLGENVIYKHAPFSYRKRFSMVKQYLQTEFVVLLADDDFYLPSTLLDSINFLKENEDYAACCGTPIGFDCEKKSGVYCIPGVYNDMNNSYRIESDLPGERMRSHMARYMPSTMYAVLRTKNWEKTIRPYTDREFPIFAIMELQMEIATAYIGKSMVLPKLGWLKSDELEQIAGPEPSLRRDTEFHEIWPSNDKKNNFREEFKIYMADLLSGIDGRSKQIVANEIELAMDSYLLWWDDYCRKNIAFFELREKIKAKLPSFLTRMIIKTLNLLRNFARSKKPKTKLLKIKELLDKNQIVVNIAELQEINSKIAKFHFGKSSAP